MTDLFATGPQATLQAAGTYTLSAANDVEWAQARVGDGTSTIQLLCRIRYPVGAPAREPRPVVLGFPGTGYGPGNIVTGSQLCEDLVSRGYVSFAFDVRGESDNPFYPGIAQGDTVSRRIRAQSYDVWRAVEWALQAPQRVTANYIIDPRGVFVIGSSAGGQTAMMYCMERNADSLPHQIAAMALCRCGFGADLISATTELRAIHTEADWTNNSPPVVAFLGGSDTSVGTTPSNWNNLLRDRFNLDTTNNTVYYDAGTAHVDLLATPPIYGRSDPFGDIANFFAPKWTAISEASSKIGFA